MKRTRAPRLAWARASYCGAPLAVAADHQHGFGKPRDGVDEQVQTLEVVGAVEAGEEEHRRRVGEPDPAPGAEAVAVGRERAQIDAGRDDA